MQGLNLHSGGELIPFEALRDVPTPPRTETHVPLPHFELVDMVKYALGYFGHEVEDEAHAIDKDGARYFGLLSLKSAYGNYSDTVGLRNSSDKTFPIGIAFGAKVFVCSNLSFVGDHVIRRKHTSNSKRDLPGLVAEIVAPLKEQRIGQHQKMLAYQQSPITDGIADQAIMQMYRKGVIGVQRIADVVDAFETPPHDWGDKTSWRLFNAATFALTGRVAERPDITKGLHQVIDGTCQRLQ